MKTSESKLFKQRLFRIHTSMGIIISLLMYIALFFGVFAIFLPYIQTWEKPSRHFEIMDIEKIIYEPMLNPILQDENYPKNDIIITLPGYMNDPALKISHRFAQAHYFNPFTHKKIKQEGQQSKLASFLNELHYGRPLKMIGRLLFGFLAVAGLFVIVSGLILILVLKFKNKGQSQQAVFSKFHVKIFTWFFAPFLIITLTGAMMNLGLLSAGPMAKILTKGELSSADALVGPVLFPKNKIIQKSKQKVQMKPIHELIQKAKNVNKDIHLQEIRLINWQDKNAQIEFKGYNPYRPFLNGGIFNKPSITLDASSSELIHYQKATQKHWSVLITEATFFLHFLFGIDIFSRTIVGLLMTACCFSVGFGVMLYLEKKAKTFKENTPFYHWFGRLSLSLIIGVIPSTALLFNLQWILPFDLEDRIIWQQGLFYNMWLATLFWAFYRLNSYLATKELLYLSSILFMSAVPLHLFYVQYNFLELFNNGMVNILGVDISLLLLSVLLAITAHKLPKNRNEAKLFWKYKKKANL